MDKLREYFCAALCKIPDHKQFGSYRVRMFRNKDFKLMLWSIYGSPMIDLIDYRSMIFEQTVKN